MKGRHKSPLVRVLIFFSKIMGICLGITILFLFVASMFRVKHVTVENGKWYTDDEIIKLTMPNVSDDISILFYLKYKLEKMEKIPFVEKVDVTYVDRNTIHLTVYDKRVVGCVELMGGYMYFDKDGIVVGSLLERMEGVPIITGLYFDKIVLYDTLKIQKEGLFDVILNIARLIEKYELPIKQVEFSSDYAVTLESLTGSRVLLGRNEAYDISLGQLKGILESTEGRKLEIDIRKSSESSPYYSAVPLE